MGNDAWIVGFHAVLGLLQSQRPVDVVYLQQGRRDRRGQRILEAAAARGLRVEMVPRAKLDRLAGAVAHNGCAARGAAVGYRSLDELVAPPGAAGRLLLLDGVEDPHNLGAVIRSAAAFAVDGIVVAGPAAPPLGAAVAAAAAGHLDRVPLARAKVAADVLNQLRKADYWSFGADSAGTPLGAVRLSERWVLCLGAEATGLRAKTRSAIDEMVAIPMAPGVESLNLSVSAGILMYEFCRLR